MGNIHTECHNCLSSIRTAKMAQITWYMKEKSIINKSKKTKGSLNIYNELNDDINDYDVSDKDNMDVDELKY
jgi:hypothetical protein